MTRRSVAQRLLTRTEEYLRECFKLESPPQVNELAKRFELRADQLSNLFVLHHGIRPSRYLKQRQIARAMALLADTDLPINQVAYRSAFSRRATFYRSFRSATGLSPEAYRTRTRNVTI